jgi:hypothetical protein
MASMAVSSRRLRRRALRLRPVKERVGDEADGEVLLMNSACK